MACGFPRAWGHPRSPRVCCENRAQACTSPCTGLVPRAAETAVSLSPCVLRDAAARKNTAASKACRGRGGGQGAGASLWGSGRSVSVSVSLQADAFCCRAGVAVWLCYSHAAPHHLSPTLASWEVLSKPCSPCSLGGNTGAMEMGLILQSHGWPSGLGADLAEQAEAVRAALPQRGPCCCSCSSSSSYRSVTPCPLTWLMHVCMCSSATQTCHLSPGSFPLWVASWTFWA